MLTKDLLIINRLGLHARAAAKLAKTAAQFGAKITVQFGSNKADAKSVMSLMLLAATKGSTLTFAVEGRDEDAAISAIEDLINDRFGEEE
jgi:phosphocarrier protein